MNGYQKDSLQFFADSVVTLAVDDNDELTIFDDLNYTIFIVAIDDTKFGWHLHEDLNTDSLTADNDGACIDTNFGTNRQQLFAIEYIRQILNTDGVLDSQRLVSYHEVERSNTVATPNGLQLCRIITSGTDTNPWVAVELITLEDDGTFGSSLGRMCEDIERSYTIATQGVLNGIHIGTFLGDLTVLTKLDIAAWAEMLINCADKNSIHGEVQRSQTIATGYKRDERIGMDGVGIVLNAIEFVVVTLADSSLGNGLDTIAYGKCQQQHCRTWKHPRV